MKRAGLFLFAIFIVAGLAGCSVVMALSGKKDPNFGAIKVGFSRVEVEKILGSQSTSTTLDDGTRLDIYEYEVGDEPSLLRASMYAICDLVFLGGGEVVLTPVEAMSTKKQKQYTHIIYDSTDHVKSITTQTIPFPSLEETTPPVGFPK